MRHLLVGLALCTSLAVVGCGRGDEPADFGVGDSGISGGTGGEGSGPTGTQGSEPADNPAADASPSSEGN
jgi:hypothetical protein